MELKTDKEYAKIDAEEKLEQEEFIKSAITYAKEFDKNNKYWLKVFKLMPPNIQKQVMYAGGFVSTGIMIWVSTGDAKTRDVKIQYLKDLEEEAKKI